MTSPKEIKTFVSYSHEDADLVADLLKRLRQRLNRAKNYRFSSWDDRRILAGERWKREIDQAIDESDLGLLFVSWSFLDSDFIVRKELPRYLDLAGGKRPVPVGLQRIEFDPGKVDIHGLDEVQFFVFEGRFYDEMASDGERDRFVNALFNEMLNLCEKYF